MKTIESTGRRLTFWNGIRAAIPVMVGYLPAGMTFGILARGVDVHVLDVIGFSGIVFAGASQYMAINLIGTGAAYIEIIIATFLLNFRHFLMSASISLRMEKTKIVRLLPIAYGITDETFSVATAQPGQLTAPYLAGLGLFSWLSWNTGSFIGFAAGNYLPDKLESAMGVALYALFAALLVPQVKRQITLAALAAAAALLNYGLSYVAFVSKGWAFVLAIIAAALLGAIFVPEQQADES